MDGLSLLVFHAGNPGQKTHIAMELLAKKLTFFLSFFLVFWLMKYT